MLGRWRRDVLPLLDSFARIRDLSPAFEPGWEEAGRLEEAALLLAEWASQRPIRGATVEVVRLPGLTPTVTVDIPASDPDVEGTVLIYSHYDKQPPFDGWTGDRSPWSPVIEGDRLYARGVADDGYALPSALVAVESVVAAAGRHGRCVVIAEGSEESGSPHLAEVLDHLGGRFGSPDVVVALDSGCPTYDRLWVTTSLRGFVDGTLTVKVLDHGVHSGSAGGSIPSSLRLVRLLLDRIEEARSGDLLLPVLRSDPPAGALADASALAVALAGAGPADEPFPVVDGLVLDGNGVADRAMRTAWAGSLAVVGADGLPPTGSAGNVLLPWVTLKLVIRLPPTADALAASAALGRALTADPPSGALVEWSPGHSADGWVAGPRAPWLNAALERASQACFGQPAGVFGEGGSIPFMGWLASRFPGSQILASGVLGPGSNAHGPDESLHLPTAERLTAALAMVLDAHARRSPGEAETGGPAPASRARA